VKHALYHPPGDGGSKRIGMVDVFIAVKISPWSSHQWVEVVDWMTTRAFKNLP